MFLAIAFLILLAVLLAVSLHFTLFAIRPNCQSPEQQAEKEQRRNQMDPALVQLPFECWKLYSGRGTRLTARFYGCGKNEKIVLLNHGYNAPWVSMLKYLPLLQKEGYAVLLPDHQAQGGSQGKWITYGILESEDGLLWLEELRSRFPSAELAVMGESMGAATALLIAEKAEGLRFCIADCPYSDTEEELRYMGRKKFHLPMVVVMPLCKIWFRLLTGRAMGEASPKKYLSQLKTPTLLIHGNDDRVVPVEMSRYLAENSASITYWEAPGAPHAGVIGRYPEEYSRRLKELEQSHEVIA